MQLRWIAAALLAALFLLAGPARPALTADILVIVDGRAVALDTPPLVQQGRLLVPYRGIAAALQGEVSWDAAAGRVVAMRAGRQVELTVGRATALIDGRARALDAAPLIYAGRVYVPLRFVGEALGADVHWDPAYRAAVVTTAESQLSGSDPSAVAALVRALGGETSLSLNGRIDAHADLDMGSGLPRAEVHLQIQHSVQVRGDDAIVHQVVGLIDGATFVPLDEQRLVRQQGRLWRAERGHWRELTDGADVDQVLRQLAWQDRAVGAGAFADVHFGSEVVRAGRRLHTIHYRIAPHMVKAALPAGLDLDGEVELLQAEFQLLIDPQVTRIRGLDGSTHLRVTVQEAGRRLATDLWLHYDYKMQADSSPVDFPVFGQGGPR